METLTHPVLGDFRSPRRDVTQQPRKRFAYRNKYNALQHKGIHNRVFVSHRRHNFQENNTKSQKRLHIRFPVEKNS